jgi:hypothetical protein
MDLAKIRATIAALKAKTTANGCTEAEALAAAEKVAELLTRHGIAEEDLAFGEAGVDIGSKRTPLTTLFGAVALFCHCRGFLVRKGNRIVYTYFGRASDLLVAEYLHEVLGRHVKDAMKAFKARPEYRRRRKPHTRSSAERAFLTSLCIVLSNKLWALQWRRQPQTTGAADHRALVLAPLGAVDAEMARRNIVLRDCRPLKTANRRFDDARVIGVAAAHAIDINAPVGAAAGGTAGLLTGA